MRSLFEFLVALTLCGVSVSDYFLYDNPSQWVQESEQCDECAQSPLHLISNQAETLSLPDLILSHYEKESTVRLTNNGDTVILTPNLYINATVTGGHHKDTLYQVESIVFHWGASGVMGSEHKIDYRKYDMEMQIIHRNVDYPSLEEAVYADDGFLILAILFQQARSDSTVPRGIKKVCDTLDGVMRYKVSTYLDNFKLNSLYDLLDMNTYFTYCGSLTVPPCTPNVVWVVFPHILDISQGCLDKFRRLQNGDRKPLVNNFRPLQQLMDRRIFRQVKRLRP